MVVASTLTPDACANYDTSRVECLPEILLQDPLESGNSTEPTMVISIASCQ